MLKSIDLAADNAIGFSASGEVTAEDYETVLIPAVEELLQREKKIRFLYHLGPEFTGFTIGAMWDDTKIGYRHIGAWERIALVTDVGWLRKSVSLISFTIPGEVKLFANEDLAEAMRWIQEPAA
jgi:hypothetical protein